MKAILDTNQNQLPRLEKAERIAKAIGLEFYIGPLRHDGLHLHDGSIRHDGQPPGQGAAVLIDLAPPARGRHWMVPETDPPDAFFFKPLSDFADAAGLPYLAADQWGYAEAIADPASLRPTQQIMVRRARDRGLNIGAVNFVDPDGTLHAHMTGGAGSRDFAPAEILGLWRVTWRGDTPPSFARAGLAQPLTVIRSVWRERNSWHCKRGLSS